MNDIERVLYAFGDNLEELLEEVGGIDPVECIRILIEHGYMELPDGPEDEEGDEEEA